MLATKWTLSWWATHLCASPIHLTIILPFDSLPRYPLLPGPISLFLPPLVRIRRARRAGIEISF